MPPGFSYLPWGGSIFSKVGRCKKIFFWSLKNITAGGPPQKPWTYARPTCRVNPHKCNSLTGRRTITTNWQVKHTKRYNRRLQQLFYLCRNYGEGCKACDFYWENMASGQCQKARFLQNIKQFLFHIFCISSDGLLMISASLTLGRRKTNIFGIHRRDSKCSNGQMESRRIAFLYSESSAWDIQLFWCMYSYMRCIG